MRTKIEHKISAIAGPRVQADEESWLNTQGRNIFAKKARKELERRPDVAAELETGRPQGQQRRVDTWVLF